MKTEVHTGFTAGLLPPFAYTDIRKKDRQTDRQTNRYSVLMRVRRINLFQ
jgi:hypothetical protein